MDTEFTRGPARRPAPVIQEPFLQWASGLQTQARSIYAGWLVEAGKLETLDSAMAEAGFSQVTIKHGTGSMVTHWAVLHANAFVIAEGVQSMQEMKHSRERYGVAFGWGTRDTGKPQSKLRARVLLRELLSVGYTEPLILTLRGTVTGDLLDGLMRQYEVLDAVDAFRKLDGKPPMQPPFYACHITLGPGQEARRGSGNETKEITPPTALMPTPITKDYIRAAWCKRDWVAEIERRLDETIAWSVAVSAQLASGNEPPAYDQGVPPMESEYAAMDAAGRYRN